ncbi:olfactory receptor 2D3-like [Phyllobates terribilis]|uniref:olfactory receptor 2D3-like n=1 Tax=Phyllobates terribilis TaxID=111132 RepID=UPI003CCB7071
MCPRNSSTVTEFILIGLSTDPSIQVLLFHIFLIIYTFTLVGNFYLILSVRTDSRLHNSMYYFLSSLSFLDIFYTTIIVPKMLVNFLALEKTISFVGCALQVYFYLWLGETECILLAFMAYDRFVAICDPLRYNAIMNSVVCVWMIGASWLTGCIISSMDMYFTYRLTYCGPNIINHFFCEVPLLLQLSCTDISVNNVVKLVGGTVLLCVPLSLILISYFRIFVSIVRIRSGRYKAFSTCISHLVVVTIFYGTAMFMYIRPKSLATEDTDKLMAVFYTVITPMLNPVIYSLRNKDVQRAMGRLVGPSPCKAPR